MEQTLYPRRPKQVLLLLLLLIVTLSIVALIQEEGGFLAWLSAIFFGLCTLAVAINLLPGATYLKLTPAGLETASLFRKHMTPWSQIDEFQVGYAGKKMVLVIYKPEAIEHLGRRQAMLAKLTGGRGGLPEVKEMTFTQLADTLNAYLAQSRQETGIQ